MDELARGVIGLGFGRHDMCDKLVGWGYRAKWVVLLDTGVVKEGLD